MEHRYGRHPRHRPWHQQHPLLQTSNSLAGCQCSQPRRYVRKKTTAELPARCRRLTMPKIHASVSKTLQVCAYDYCTPFMSRFISVSMTFLIVLHSLAFCSPITGELSPVTTVWQLVLFFFVLLSMKC